MLRKLVARFNYFVEVAKVSDNLEIIFGRRACH
jgi:hypothetical protein